MEQQSDVVLANRLLAAAVGQQFIQFRMGTALFLDLDRFAVTIETPLRVATAGSSWTGRPLSEGAAGALLPLTLQLVTGLRVSEDAALHVAIGEAAITVPPDPQWEARQVSGPDGMLLVGLGRGELGIWEH